MNSKFTAVVKGDEMLWGKKLRAFFLLPTLFAGAASGAPVVSGFQVTTYASAPSPVNMTWGADGVLFAGGGGESGGPDFISRIAFGGSSSGSYGAVALSDPDAVAFDANGTISGTSGSVLVGGGGTGVAAILPDESVVTIFSASLFGDINKMIFDHSGRLLIMDTNRIAIPNGDTVSTLISLPQDSVSIAVDGLDNIYVSLGDGRIQKYASDGTLINGLFANGTGTARLDFSTGDAFGDSLYSLTDGILGRYAADGSFTEIGSGFDERFSFPLFSSSGDLYVSEIRNNQILKVSPVPEPSIAVLLFFGFVGMLLIRHQSTAVKSRSPISWDPHAALV